MESKRHIKLLKTFDNIWCDKSCKYKIPYANVNINIHIYIQFHPFNYKQIFCNNPYYFEVAVLVSTLHFPFSSYFSKVLLVSDLTIQYQEATINPPLRLLLWAVSNQHWSCSAAWIIVCANPLQSWTPCGAASASSRCRQLIRCQESTPGTVTARCRETFRSARLFIWGWEGWVAWCMACPAWVGF